MSKVCFIKLEKANNLPTKFTRQSGFTLTEVDWRNLCPKSRAELGDALNIFATYRFKRVWRA
jgi:hypothetical protein